MSVRSSTELYKGQRLREKRALFENFPFRCLEDLCKARFYALFGNQCFKCGSEGISHYLGRFDNLCMDHHVPMKLGGHLVPGNLTALCRRCNGKKLDLLPELFYSEQELERLAPFLEQQKAIFGFQFDVDAWHAAPADYLISLGVAQDLVHAILYDEEHIDFMGLPDRPHACTVSISIDIGSLATDD